MLVGLAMLLALGVFSVRATILDPQLPTTLSYFKLLDGSGVADERLAYFGNTYNQGLVISGLRDTDIGSNFAGRNWVFTKFREASFHGAIGKVGYKDGPDIYQADPYALVDPLLARLPARDPIGWRIGHFKRNIPAGYPETLKDGALQIADPDLALYYEKLSYVVSGPLWKWERILEIWKFNTGQYNHLIASYVARNPGQVFEAK
jgi:arabinofuranosyltransferase